MSTKCVCCNDDNTVVHYLWNLGDKRKNIPVAPLDLKGSRICHFCYVDVFDSTLEERVRAGLKGQFSGQISKARNFLYASSHPRFPKDPDHDAFSLISVSQYDSLLFSLDAKRLGFDQAFSILQKTHAQRSSLVMYNTFYEGCKKRFKSHGNWYDMYRLRPKTS